MKRFLSIILAAAMIVSMFAVAGCKGNEPAKNESAVQKIIKEAQGLSLEELAKKRSGLTESMRMESPRSIRWK